MSHHTVRKQVQCVSTGRLLVTHVSCALYLPRTYRLLHIYEIETGERLLLATRQLSVFKNHTNKIYTDKQVYKLMVLHRLFMILSSS